MKVRAGRGFTFDELKAAGINRKEARSIGIAVDHRRRNRSEESLQRNVERLQLYKSKLIVFPRRAGKAKKGDSEAAELAQASQVSGELFPVKNTVTIEEPRAITSEEQTFSAFQTLLNLRSDLRQAGNRAKIAKAKAEEEAQKVKK
ncbi:ribosomal protein rpl13 [Conidiobolus coronatus NRRL 28638]|uniref:60S ribosomal protein L13 n=1 Tax=Conidiobolus coronatus (strain ATCC 28846 / CBS 209.66 / NRRL 28638) TaxID=796925 RepID=A0A137NWU9_CONC2|nr:ribosomal protein rpl13 [Conidiobolus coronatus NRRL 28638]|eukprot:KXN67178.1 ribosomal protein rpl13 [Conidiobolus coronatus NRRL 28638]